MPTKGLRLLFDQRSKTTFIAKKHHKIFITYVLGQELASDLFTNELLRQGMTWAKVFTSYIYTYHLPQSPKATVTHKCIVDPRYLRCKSSREIQDDKVGHKVKKSATSTQTQGNI